MISPVCEFLLVRKLRNELIAYLTMLFSTSCVLFALNKTDMNGFNSVQCLISYYPK